MPDKSWEHDGVPASICCKTAPAALPENSGVLAAPLTAACSILMPVCPCIAAPPGGGRVSARMAGSVKRRGDKRGTTFGPVLSNHQPASGNRLPLAPGAERSAPTSEQATALGRADKTSVRKPTTTRRVGGCLRRPRPTDRVVVDLASGSSDARTTTTTAPTLLLLTCNDVAARHHTTPVAAPRNCLQQPASQQQYKRAAKNEEKTPPGTESSSTAARCRRAPSLLR